MFVCVCLKDMITERCVFCAVFVFLCLFHWFCSCLLSAYLALSLLAFRQPFIYLSRINLSWAWASVVVVAVVVTASAVVVEAVVIVASAAHWAMVYVTCRPDDSHPAISQLSLATLPGQTQWVYVELWCLLCIQAWWRSPGRCDGSSSANSA